MRRLALALVATTALGMVACTPAGFRNQSTDNPSTTPPTISSSPGPSVSGTPTPQSPASAPGGGPGDLGPVVATRTTSYQGDTLALELHGIERRGNLSVLQFRLSAPDADQDNAIQVGNMFDDDNSSAGDDTSWTTDGITLVDNGHSKLYLVASDGRGHCLCSRGLLDEDLKSDQPVLLSSSFAALPATVTAVDVRVPHFGVFTDVPVG